MPFKRWDPFQDLLAIHRELFGAMEEMARGAGTASAWTPATDIYETDDAYIIKAEVPGVPPDRVKVEYRDHRLILSGEKPEPEKEAQVKYHHLERNYGPFEKVFSLPRDVCCEEIEAHYKDGVLEVLVPKAPEAKPKTIKVKG